MDNDQLKQQRAPQLQPYDNYVQDEIDVRKLFGILWAEKWLIIVVTAAAAVISVVVSLMMTEIYHAEAILVSAESEQSAGGLAAQFGGAAALLGVSIGGGGGDDISNAIAIIRSRQFIGRFIAENNLFVPLFASRWDKNEKRSIVDEKIYNTVTGEWLRESGAPTEREAYRLFSEILLVSGPDRENGIVTLAINWHNPVEAAAWANQLVASINREVRARDVSEANNAIAYLRRQLESTQLVEMQRVFYQLIESQTRITMLADVREEYVFRMIDPAVTPDRKSAPNRSLIVILGTIAGGVIGLMVAVCRRFFNNSVAK